MVVPINEISKTKKGQNSISCSVLLREALLKTVPEDKPEHNSVGW